MFTQLVERVTRALRGSGPGVDRRRPSRRFSPVEGFDGLEERKAPTAAVQMTMALAMTPVTITRTTTNDDAPSTPPSQPTPPVSGSTGVLILGNPAPAGPIGPYPGPAPGTVTYT
jgi:hypothetical protein